MAGKQAWLWKMSRQHCPLSQQQVIHGFWSVWSKAKLQWIARIQLSSKNMDRGGRVHIRHQASKDEKDEQNITCPSKSSNLGPCASPYNAVLKMKRFHQQSSVGNSACLLDINKGMWKMQQVYSLLEKCNRHLLRKMLTSPPGQKSAAL